MKYKVMWIDDNPEDNEALFDATSINDIDLEHFYTSKEGMVELERNIELYDAVILDGLVFKDSRDEKASLEGLQNSISKLNELKNKRLVPYFIYSGYLGSDKYDSARELLSADKIYRKPADSKLLIEDIILAIDEQEISQLKHKYKSVFNFIDKLKEPDKQYKVILQLLRDLENNDFIMNQKEALTPIRKIVEAVFFKLNEIGLIPDEIQNMQGGINGSSFFIAGLNKDYEYKEEIMHPVICNSIKYILDITQDASHNEGNKLRVDTYLSESNVNYIYKSLLYAFVEVCSYFNQFLEDNNNKEINLLKWSKKEECNLNSTGSIEQDEKGNYHCLGYLLNYKFVQDNGYIVGNIIRIISFAKNSNTRTNEFYPLYVSKFEAQN